VVTRSVEVALSDSHDPSPNGTTTSTERQRDDEALRRSEARYRALVEASRQAVWSWSPDGVNVDFQNTMRWWEEITGQTVEEQERRHDSWLVVVHPDDREAAGKAWGTAIATGSPYDVEYRVRAKEGGWRYVKARGVPIPGPHGTAQEWVGTLQDVTERRVADAARREGEERLRLALEASGTGVWEWDIVTGRITWSEQVHAFYGMAPGEFDGTLETFARHLHPDDAGRAREAIRASVEDDAPYRIEYRIVPKGGGVRWIFTAGRVIRDTAGRPLRMIGATSDVTERKQAEEVLARVTSDSERRKRLYEAVLSTTPDLAYVWGLDHRFMYANEGLLKMWGKTWDEAVGKNCLELGYEPWHAAMHDREIDEVVATKRPVRGEVPFAGTFGRRMYDYILMPVLGADGDVEAVAGITRDVTERKRQEESLRQGEELLRLATDAAELGVWVWDVAEDRVTWENDRPYEIFGLDRSAGPVNAARFRDEFVHPDDAGAFGSAVERAVRTGDRFYFQGRLRRPNGEVRWVEFTGRPVRTDNGLPLRMHGTAADITERTRAEAEAARLAERLRLALDAGDLGTWEWDPATDEMITSDRASEMYGTTPGVPYSREDGRRLIHPDDRERAREAAARAVAEKTAYDIEYRLADRPVWISAHGRGVYDAAGNLVRVYGVVQDVTERKRTELELREQDRKKDDFIALLAHELRNPLAPIRNGLQVLRLGGGNPDAVTRARDMMDRQLTHMVRLIDDLLDVSRINRNKMELRRARVTLTDVLANAVETARPAVDAAGHELTISLPATPVVLDADMTRLAQVFSNLLTNSAKYTPKGGKVWLSAVRTGEHVEVSVRDTGIGIPPKSLPTIFDMFSQVDRSVEKTTGGLGIGLALVKGLVEMHGGSVSAASDGEGRGSVFTVTLPLATGVSGGEAVVGAQPSAPARRILVVDDNRDGAESMADMLGLLGHEVRTAFDGLEAIEAAEAFRPDVVLMDVGMPRLNGLDATRRIREQGWGKDVAIVALTGWGQEGDRDRSREAGCDAHLVKPVNVSDLQQVLAEVAK
jgi:PAS domain S-box-containing protein